MLGVLLMPASALAAPLTEPDERTKAAARQLAQDGARAFDAGRHAEARDLLDRAYRLYPAPTIAVLEGRALEKLGQLVEAAEHYERARRTRLSPQASQAFHAAVFEAERALAALRPRIPQLTIQVIGLPADHPELDVELDGARVPPALIGVRRPIDPGEHRVVARVAGGPPVERVFRIAERQHEKVELPIIAPPPIARDDSRARSSDSDGGSNAQRTWGYVGLGVGAAGIATGAVAGLVMLDRKSRLDDACTPTCPESSQDDLDTFRSARTWSLIGYGVGVVGLATGAVLVLTAPSDDARRERRTDDQRRARNSASLAIGAGPGELGLAAFGRF